MSENAQDIINDKGMEALQEAANTPVGAIETHTSAD